MKFSSVTATLLLSANAAAALKLSAKARAKSEFMAAMKDVAERRGLEMNSKLRSESNKREILSKSKQVGHRKLDWSSFYSSNSNTTYYDPFTADDDLDLSDLFFDMSKFSMKVHSCSTFTNFDLEQFMDGEERDEEGDSYDANATTTSTFINYRLCPSDSCQDGSWKGCRTVYGNYMVPLEDYFEAQQRSMEDTFEQYCNYCKQCDYISQYLGATCEYSDACSSYASVCYEEERQSGDEEEEGEQEEEMEEIRYEEFVECTPVEIYVPEEVEYYNTTADYNGTRRLEEAEEAEEEEEEGLVYLQIYCDGDLKIGMYSDDQCTDYIGDQYDISEMTGLPITEDDLGEDYLTSDCISCKQSGSKFYLPEQQSGDKSGDSEEEEELNEMCEQLYEESLQCNENIPFNYTAYYDDEGVVEEWEESMNNVTCAFLESVQKGEVDNYTVVTSTVTPSSTSSSSVAETVTAYSMSFYNAVTSNTAQVSGQSYAYALVAVGAVGAAIFAAGRQRKADGEDLNEALYHKDNSEA